MTADLSAAIGAAMSAFPSNPCRSGVWGTVKVCVTHPGWGAWDEEADACPLVARIVRASAPVVLRAEIEYGIVRPSQTPSMSGRPLWVQITSATFSTREQAELALRNVPSLRDKEYAARIVSRRAPGSWCPVEEGDQP